MSSSRGRHLIPQDFWDKRDWTEHWAEQVNQPLSGEPIIEPPLVMPSSGFGLFETEADRRAEERSRGIDRLLEAYKVRPKRAR